MTIKELKVKFPPEKYEWYAHKGYDASGYLEADNNYEDGDIVQEVRTLGTMISVYWEKAKPAPKTLSKTKLDEVIELTRKYFLAPLNSVEGDNAMKSLWKAKKDCGEEIYDTGLIDIVRTIISSTKERNTPNETIYKVFEALGYEIK